MARLLHSDLTAETTIEGIPAEGAQAADVDDIYSITLPPSKDYPNLKVIALIEVYQSATATANAVNFVIRAGGKANWDGSQITTPDASFVHTTRNGIIDRQLNRYEVVIPDCNGGGTLKFQVYGAAADAEVDITGRGLMVEAV